jgi:predicted nucleotidyltransferase
MNIGPLPEVTSLLHRLNIRYVVIGGVAALYYDVPRMTFDIDILISPLDKQRADKLANALAEKDPSLNIQKTRKNLEKGGIFRVDWRGVTVVDFVVRKGVAPILERAIKAEGIKVVSLEDLVLLKLSAIREIPLDKGMRFKDREDAEVLLTVHRKRLDLDYLREGAKKTGTLGLLNKFLKKVSRRAGR